MSAALQQPLPLLSVYQQRAREIPGFRSNSIVGEGQYAIKILCTTHRGILLFETTSQRNRAMLRLDQNDDKCEGRHFRINL